MTLNIMEKEFLIPHHKNTKNHNKNVRVASLQTKRKNVEDVITK